MRRSTDLGLIARGQDLEEQPVRLRVLAQRAVDQLERALAIAHRVRMEGEVVASARWKMRIRLTGSRAKTSGSAMLMRLLSTTKSSLSGICGVWRGRKRADEAVEHRRRLGLTLLERRAEDGGEVADLLGDQEVVLHEALDVFQAGMRGVAEPHRDLALDVEGQPLLGAAGHEMHVAAHRPQEILGLPEQLSSAPRRRRA